MQLRGQFEPILIGQLIMADFGKEAYPSTH